MSLHYGVRTPFGCFFLFCGVFCLSLVSVVVSQRSNCTIQWVPFNETTPAELEPVGKEVHKLENGTVREYGTSYVGRALVKITGKDGDAKKGIIPGKFIHKLRLYSYNRQSHRAEETAFEYLKTPRGGVSWVPGESITYPGNLIVGGYDPEAPLEPYYICRFLHVDCRGTHLVNGKLSSNGICSVEFWGKEVSNTTYEALVLNAFGQILRGGDVNC